MKLFYEGPEIEIGTFNVSDVLTVSQTGENDIDDPFKFGDEVEGW